MKRIIKAASILMALIVFFAMTVIPDPGEAASPVIETHHYHPIAVLNETTNKRNNDCSTDSCELRAVAKGGASEAVSGVNAEVHDVSITTAERDKFVEAGSLESVILQRASVSFSNGEGGSGAENFSVVGVEGSDVVKYLQPTDGFVGCTVKIRISEGGDAIGFVETNVYVTYMDSGSDDDKDNKQDKKEQSYTVHNGSDNNGGGGGGGEDNGGGGGTIIPPKKNKTDELKKYTAEITAKEREKDKAIAVAPGTKEEDKKGPDPITISLFALAAVLAAVFYRWIRSDLKIIRWHDQKKALRREKR